MTNKIKTCLLDNNSMITESMIKSGVLPLSGEIKFRAVSRSSYRGIQPIEKEGKQSYVLSFGVHSSEKTLFYDLYTDLNKLREFSNLNSIEVFIRKLKLAMPEDRLIGSIYFKSD